MPTKPKPKLDPAVEEFYKQLLDKGNPTDEEIDLIHTLLSNEKLATEIKSGVHARKLTDREVDKTKEERKAFETAHTQKMKELEDLEESLTTASAEEVVTLREQQKILKEQMYKIWQTAQEYKGGVQFLKAVDLEDITKIGYVPPTTPPSKKTKDDSPILSADDILKQVEGSVSTDIKRLAQWTVDSRKIEREYEVLTGKPIDWDDFQAKIVAAKGDYAKAYLEGYDIPALREKKKVEGIRAELSKEFDEKLSQEKAKFAIPTNERKMENSDFYKSIESTVSPEEKKARELTSPGISDKVETVAAAASMFSKIMEKKGRDELTT